MHIFCIATGRNFKGGDRTGKNRPIVKLAYCSTLLAGLNLDTVSSTVIGSTIKN